MWRDLPCANVLVLACVILCKLNSLVVSRADVQFCDSEAKQLINTNITDIDMGIIGAVIRAGCTKIFVQPTVCSNAPGILLPCTRKCEFLSTQRDRLGRSTPREIWLVHATRVFC